MADVLTLLVICAAERLWKSMLFFCKVGWLFIKFMAWLTIVPALDILLLGFTLVAFLLGKLFKKRTPKLKHTPRWVIYPAWGY